MVSDPISSVLFVCLGNICRSPTAEGVFRSMAKMRGMQDKLTIDSAGTGAWHAGEPADARMQQACRKRGYALTSRARQVVAQDFQRFDLILAMDRDNHRDLLARCPANHQAKVRLFRSFDPEPDSEDVPDPYYGGPDGFEHVVDIVERCTERLLEQIASRR